MTAILLRWLLDPLLGDDFGLLTIYGAVAFAVWFGRWKPAVLTSVVGFLGLNYLYLAPRHSLMLNGRILAAFMGYSLSCGLIICLGELMNRGRDQTEVERRERRRAEDAQAREQELLATTLASIRDAVIATEVGGRITYFNGEAERLTGWTSAEAVGKLLPTVFCLINESGREPAENPLDRVLRTREIAGPVKNTMLVAKNRTETTVEHNASPIRDPDGSLSGVLLVFRDVTIQRKARQASTHLAAIVEFSGDAIMTKNLDGVIQSWNASAERLFGYRPEEIIGKPVTTLFPPERLKEEDQILERLRIGRPAERIDTIRLTKDGRRIPVSVNVSPIKDPEGRVIGASKIIHDITELVTAREALFREKELLSTTLASIGDGVIVTDVGGRVVFLNSEAERLTGWKSSESAGRPLAEVFRVINKKTRMPVEDPVEIVLHLGKPVALAKHTLLIGKDGSETPIDDSAAPIRQSGGPFFGVVLIFRDFTERNRSEEALRAAHEQLANRALDLEKLVEQRTLRLNEIIGDLEAFSYSIVHDMRGPLRAIQGFIELLRPECGQLSPLGDNYMKRVSTAAERMDRLIQDGLNYSRLLRSEVRLVPVDTAALLRGIIETYPALQAPAAQIVLEGTFPLVQANEAGLTQCVSNLLGNAVKFVARGVTPRVCVRAELRGDRVVLLFQDNGIGIPGDAHEKIFQIFQRLENSYEGTGIGLAIVKKAAERLGGAVGLESAPGQGSTFWLELARADLAEQNATRGNHPREKILYDSTC